MPYKNKDDDRASRARRWAAHLSRMETDPVYAMAYSARHSAALKRYRARHREACRRRSREARAKNLESARESTRTYMRKWRAENPEESRRRDREKLRKRRENDPSYRKLSSLRAMMNQVIRGKVGDVCSMRLLGCTVEVFRRHLESQFTDGMSWDNYGRKGWHADHIVPCAAFDFTVEEQRKQCFHYTNIQPTWWHVNIKTDSPIADLARVAKGTNGLDIIRQITRP